MKKASRLVSLKTANFYFLAEFANEEHGNNHLSGYTNRDHSANNQDKCSLLYLVFELLV